MIPSSHGLYQRSLLRTLQGTFSDIKSVELPSRFISEEADSVIQSLESDHEERKEMDDEDDDNEGDDVRTIVIQWNLYKMDTLRDEQKILKGFTVV